MKARQERFWMEVFWATVGVSCLAAAYLGHSRSLAPPDRPTELVMVPKNDPGMFPRNNYDPEFDPAIDRKMIKAADRDIAIPPNPFQPGTRPTVAADGEDR